LKEEALPHSHSSEHPSAKGFREVQTDFKYQGTGFVVYLLIAKQLTSSALKLATSSVIKYGIGLGPWQLKA
jgi:hypothetical protein